MDNTNAAASTTDTWELFKINLILVYLVCGLVVVPGLILWSVAPDSIKYPIMYSIIYQTHYRNVHVEKMPTDCDWSRAPLGDKGCHYKREMVPNRAETGRVTEVWTTWEKVQD